MRRRRRRRARRGDAGRSPTSAPACTSTAAAPGPGRAELRPLRRLRRPAPLPPATRREPVAITPEPEDAGGAALRRLRLTPDGETLVCVREVHGEGEAENQIVSLPLDGRARADGARRAAATSTPSRASAPTAPARLDLLGPPEHALGRDRAVGGAARRPGRGAPGRRRARRVDLPARLGRARAACTSSPTATAGGTSTAVAAARAEPSSSRERSRPRPPAVALRRLDATPSSTTGRSSRAQRARRERLGAARPPAPRRCATSTCPSPPSASPRSRPAAARSPSPPPAPSASRGRRLRHRRRRAGDGRGVRATSRSTPPTSRPRARSSSRPATAQSPTPSTTRRPTPTSRRRRANGRR